MAVIHLSHNVAGVWHHNRRVGIIWAGLPPLFIGSHFKSWIGLSLG